MTDESQWKARYMQSLERLEHRETLWEARVDLLRRGLVRTSLAAEGADRRVDECMRDLRSSLRADDYDAPLERLIPRLEDLLLATEGQRQQRRSSMVASFRRLIEQLLALSPPADVRKPLRRLLGQVEERVEAGELPQVLEELARLQGPVTGALLADDGDRSRGLLSRLFGGRGGERAEEPAPLAEVASDAAVGVAEAPVAQASAAAAPPAPQPVAPPGAGARIALDSLPLPGVLWRSEAAAEDEESFELPVSPEPAYSVIAERIRAVFCGILAELNLPESFQDQAAALDERVRQGLNWYELVPALENLAVLVLAVNGDAEREFQRYLASLNRRLSLLQEVLGDAREGHELGAEASRTLDQQVREQVDGLRNSVSAADDLGSLKRAVESRLDRLLGSLDTYQQQREQQQLQVSARLQSLLERVEEMEREAEGSRKSLEEQRRQALQDPLTGVGNRAAWNERLALEIARQRRSGSELLLAVLDLDRFKSINDGFGHLAGDKVLKIVAGEFAKRVRQTDFLARFGGEEFALLLPDTPLQAGQQLLEELLTNIEGCPFHFRGERVTVTVSAGLTQVQPGEEFEQAFERADQALYQAKQQGRNRVCLG